MTHDAQKPHGGAPSTVAHAEHQAPSLNALAFSATRHCLTGCAIGEITGVGLAAFLGLPTLAGLGLGIFLAFVFGYGLTLVPLLQAGVALGRALTTALAADTVSIVVMEVVDNAFIALVPGAMEAGLTDPLLWASLLVGLAIAFVVTFPVNRWLIARGAGHAVVHARHK